MSEIGTTLDRLPLDRVLQPFGNLTRDPRLTGGSAVLPRTGPLADRLAPGRILARNVLGGPIGGGADAASRGPGPLARTAGGRIAADPNPFPRFNPVTAQNLSAGGRLGQFARSGVGRTALGIGGIAAGSAIGGDFESTPRGTLGAATAGAGVGGGVAGPVGAAVGGLGVGLGDLGARGLAALTGGVIGDEKGVADLFGRGGDDTKGFTNEVVDPFKERLSALPGLSISDKEAIIALMNEFGAASDFEGDGAVAAEAALGEAVNLSLQRVQETEFNRAQLAQQAAAAEFFGRIGADLIGSAENSLAIVQASNQRLNLPPEVAQQRLENAQLGVERARRTGAAYAAQAQLGIQNRGFEQRQAQIDSIASQISNTLAQQAIADAGFAGGGGANLTSVLEQALA